MLEVTGFQKAYRGTLAVKDLSFSIEPGAIMGLLGPNGAGKTSTLRSIAGIIPPTQGTLKVAGHDIVKDSIHAKQQLAYVPDDPKLFETLTVFEHLQFIAKAYHVADWQRKAETLLGQFELLEKRNTLAHELSRGMRQKVAICCAYLHDPKLIMFDEPHTGLDPRGIRTMKDSVEQRARDGAAVIVSSHLLELVEDVCTHLLILHRGQSLFFGRIEDVRATFAEGDASTSLEEIFFRVTEGGGETVPDLHQEARKP
ncbi:MAG: hypothetical protein AMXMBFR84_40750 [Candidatus Hydrogenedentota bacterium]